MNNFQNQYQPNPFQPIANPNSLYNQPPSPYNQPPSTYNQQPYANNINPNQPNTFIPNPAFFRGSVPNHQLNNNQTIPNKLSEEEYYNSGSLMQNARKSFVAKVYMMLSLQLLFTAIIGYLGYNNHTFQSIFLHPAVIIIVSVGLLAVSIIMSCCTDFFRRHALPLFLIFTFLMSILVAASIVGFKSKIILTAVVITLVLTIGLTIFACILCRYLGKTQSDLTGCGVYLMIIGLVLLVFGIICIFWRDPIVQLVYSCLAAFVFAIYLVFDTQLVLGKGQYSYSLDDTYIAAIQLYIDIIQLFLNLLRILQYFDR